MVDCRHPARLARFWAAALDDFELLPYDDDEIARLARLGLTPDTDTCVVVISSGLELCFQQVDVSPTPKKSLHLDICSTSRSSEVHRLVALGATVREDFEEHTWMLDPEGNDFCVTGQSERA